MSPFWEMLDKIGIVIGIGAVLIDMVLAFWMWRISEDVEDIEEEMNDSNE